MIYICFKCGETVSVCIKVVSYQPKSLNALKGVALVKLYTRVFEQTDQFMGGEWGECPQPITEWSKP
jgi:hypothetical protein